MKVQWFPFVSKKKVKFLCRVTGCTGTRCTGTGSMLFWMRHITTQDGMYVNPFFCIFLVLPEKKIKSVKCDEWIQFLDIVSEDFRRLPSHRQINGTPNLKWKMNIFHHVFPLLLYTRFHTIKFEEHSEALWSIWRRLLTAEARLRADVNCFNLGGPRVSSVLEHFCLSCEESLPNLS